MSESAELQLHRHRSAGVLEMACHVPGHYESNMRLAITVQ